MLFAVYRRGGNHPLGTQRRKIGWVNHDLLLVESFGPLWTHTYFVRFRLSKHPPCYHVDPEFPFARCSHVTSLADIISLCNIEGQIEFILRLAGR